MSTTIRHRLTSLERWGLREAADFQPASVAHVRQAGFSGILINGGSGIGPDQILPESMVVTTAIPDLMPHTAAGEAAEARRRYNLTCDAGLDPWLIMWGVPGPDEGSQGQSAGSNSFFDRRSKLEMLAKLRRTPEFFGHRPKVSLSWRGNRPLCISHPTVQAFYEELAAKLIEQYPHLTGLFFFPGDNEAELCTSQCPRCTASGLAGWPGLYCHVNRLYRAFRRAKPDFQLYVAVWNQEQTDGPARIRELIGALDPGIGIAMSISDGREVTAGGVTYRYNQPWVNMPEPGDLFLSTIEQAAAAGRPVMVMGELGQSEVWDPACHNLPEPAHVLRLLANTEALEPADALLDFWGHRGPFLSHANFRAMEAYFQQPDAQPDELLRQAAMRHYTLPADSPLIQTAFDTWETLRQAIDNRAIQGWQQRFSFAIGRAGARGALYKPLIAPILREFSRTGWTWTGVIHNHDGTAPFLDRMCRDKAIFEQAADRFSAFADDLQKTDHAGAASLARREAANIRLAASLMTSIARFTVAVDQYHADDAESLRATIRAEIAEREHQLRLSGRIGHGGGVNPLYVSEDLQLMRFYISCHDFPHVPDDCFQWTDCPYTV